MLSRKLAKVWRAPQSILTNVTLFFLVASAPLFGRASSGTGTVFVGWDPNPEPDIAGYRVHYGIESGTYTEILDVGMLTEAELPAPSAGQPIYTAVTAYNTADLESGFSTELVITAGTGSSLPPGEGRLITLEAEFGTLVPPMVSSSTSGIGFVESTVSETGTVALGFDAVAAGDYYVWCRLRAPSTGADSYHISLDGGTESIFYVYGSATPDPSLITSDWTWQRVHIPDGGPLAFPIASQGLHTLTFRTREAGTQLDRVVLSTNPDFVPGDALPTSGDIVAIVSQPESASAEVGESVSLQAEVVSNGSLNYQWTKNGAAIPGANGPNLTIPAATLADGGSYQLNLWSGTAFVTSETAQVTVVDAPFVIRSLTINGDQTLSIDVGGKLGQDIQVFASSNLVDWTLIGTFLNDSQQATVVDPTGTGQGRRFYRLEAP